MSESEDQVREAIDSAFEVALQTVLPGVVLGHAVNAAAQRTLEDAWPTLPVHTIAAIDSGSPGFFTVDTAATHLPDLTKALVEGLFAQLHPPIATALPGNKHAKPGKVRSRIEDCVTFHSARISALAAEELVRLAAPGAVAPALVREQVVAMLAGACVAEGQQAAVDRRVLRHHLKVLAFLATCREQPLRRQLRWTPLSRQLGCGFVLTTKQGQSTLSTSHRGSPSTARGTRQGCPKGPA